MSSVLIIIHIVVCAALILIVLLQTGKGADMGAAFGGGSSQTLFGSTGASTFLGKLTTVAAVIFMLTSLGLAYLSTNRTGTTIMPENEIPIEQTLPPQTQPGDQPSQPATGQPQSEQSSD
jgi:preprotein translocase subunit SecG